MSAVAIVGSLGTATPAVIATYAPYVVGTLGATSFLYGTSEAVEGIEKIYYGSTGDIETVAINPIRDLLPEDMRGVYYAVGQGSTIALNLMAMVTGFKMIHSQYGWAGVGIEAGKIGITGAATYRVGEALEAGGADGSTIMLVQLGTTVLVYGTLSGIQSAVMKPQEVGNVKPPKLDGEGGIGTSLTDFMSPEDAERYLYFLEHGSTAGLSEAELYGIGQVDDYLALQRVNYDEVLKLRNVGVEGGFKTKLDYITSNGLELKATPGRTTTVLGSFKDDTGAIIEELGNVKSLDFGSRDGGFNLLNVPDELYISPDQFWNEYNKPWLDNAILRNDIIKIGTEPTYDNLYRLNNVTGEVELTGFGREFKYLTEKCGYIYDEITKILIPPR